MTPLLTLFTETLSSLNITSLDEQNNAIFKVATREFFSHVSPLYEVNKQIAKDLKVELGLNTLSGYSDIENRLELNIGKFYVQTEDILTHTIALRVIPLELESFMLKMDYMGDYQYVVEFFLNKVERDNMEMLRTAGIDNFEFDSTIDISQVREYLKSRYSIRASEVIF